MEHYNLIIKFMRKIFFVLVLATTAFAVIAKKMYFTTPESDLILANVEALSQSENEFACVLTKDECSFTISTDAQLEIVKKVFSLFDASIGATVDLSSGTQIYRQKRFWESGVRCGTDVTCNDFINQLGL